MRVDSLDGRPLAALVNYTCHPIFAGSASRLISPDYPGPMRRTVERETGATCLFLQGATGNMNPRNPMHPDTREAERAGTVLGLEAAKTFLEIDTRTTVEREYWLTSVATFHLVRQEPVDSGRPDRVAARETALSLPLLPCRMPQSPAHPGGARRGTGDPDTADHGSRRVESVPLSEDVGGDAARASSRSRVRCASTFLSRPCA